MRGKAKGKNFSYNNYRITPAYAGKSDLTSYIIIPK